MLGDGRKTATCRSVKFSDDQKKQQKKEFVLTGSNSEFWCTLATLSDTDCGDVRNGRDDDGVAVRSSPCH